MSVQSMVMQQFASVAKQQSIELAPLSNEVVLLDSGLDSLCLAVVVARLEDELGVDPFATASEPQLPVTVGDFVRLYEDAVNKQLK
jgi:acyl carrier protein